ncbi:hypothetical protein F4860DRAFT_57598 [Xylaria cubensis]|nr:hypothetical protein F4860DRAFT_57598 [Xylaria cubensis]
MELVGTGAAGLQIIDVVGKAYRRLRNAYNAPKQWIRLVQDTQNRIEIVEKLAERGRVVQALSHEASQALDDLREALRLVDHPGSSSIVGIPDNQAQKRLWKRLRIFFKHLHREEKINRIQDAIVNRVPWLLLDAIVNSQTQSSLGSEYAISSTTTLPTATPKSDCKISFSFAIRRCDFVGRSVEMETLVDIIASCQGQPRVALVGLPGIGKTRFALEYARLAQQISPETQVFLVCASSEDRLQSDLAEIVMPNSTGARSIYQNLTDQSGTKSTSYIATILIVDDYNSRNTLFGPKRLVNWLPEDNSCVIVFLSWDPSLIANVVENDCILRLGGINSRHFKEILDCNGSYGRDDAADKIYTTIGSSPLILQLAWDLVRDNGLQLSEYIDLFSQVKERISLVQHKVFDPVSGQTRSILESVLPIFHFLERSCPLSFEVLKLACCLSNRDIPHFLLRLACSSSNETELENAIVFLKRLSIFSYDGKEKHYSVDPLIGAVLQCHLRLTDSLRDILLLASEVTLRGMSEKSATGDQANCDLEYLEHGKAILCLCAQHEDVQLTRSSATLGSALVRALRDFGCHEQAQRFATLIVEMTQTSLGPDDEQYLTARSDLAMSLDRAGLFSQAEKETRAVLQRRETLLGPAHPNTLASMRNLALIIEHQGGHGEAETIYREMLDLQASNESPTSMATLSTKQNLAVSLQNRGKFEEAYELFQQVLLGRKQNKDSVLAVYLSMSNVGCSLWDQKRIEEAWVIHNEVFSRCEQDLGREHPQTIRSITWLALILQKMGRGYLCAAERYWVESLELYRTRLGRQHPDTLRTQRCLAIVLHKRGRHGKALKVCQDLYELTRKHAEFGPRHSDALAIKEHAKKLKDEIEDAKRKEMESCRLNCS